MNNYFCPVCLTKSHLRKSYGSIICDISDRCFREEYIFDFNTAFELGREYERGNKW
jgi:hypothetical protein